MFCWNPFKKSIFMRKWKESSELFISERYKSYSDKIKKKKKKKIKAFRICAVTDISEIFKIVERQCTQNQVKPKNQSSMNSRFYYTVRRSFSLSNVNSIFLFIYKFYFFIFLPFLPVYSFFLWFWTEDFQCFRFFLL